MVRLLRRSPRPSERTALLSGLAEEVAQHGLPAFGDLPAVYLGGWARGFMDGNQRDGQQTDSRRVGVESQGFRERAASMPMAEAAYYDLWTKPFRESIDPSVLWMGLTYREAFAALRTGIVENAGLLLLTGKAGSGKTILANVLADGLRAEGVCVAKLTLGGLAPDDFRHAVTRALALPALPDTHETFLGNLSDFLRGAYARRAKVLLYIDEAQELGPEVLTEIEHLVRVGREAGRNKVNVLNVLLVGHSDLEASLRRREPPGLAEAIRIRARLEPLGVRQVRKYIAFRLRVAGADRELFSKEATRAIGAASNGVPRLINRICDYALQTASERNERVVSAKVVGDAIKVWGLAATGDANGAFRRFYASGRRRFVIAAAVIGVIGLGAAVYYVADDTNADRDRRMEDLRPVPGAKPVADIKPPPGTANPGPQPAVLRPSARAATPAPSTSVAGPRVEPVRPSPRLAEGLPDARRQVGISRPSGTMSSDRRPVGRPDDAAANMELLLRYQAP
jgi:type II secretory pathway predicted ATPase ExeA